MKIAFTWPASAVSGLTGVVVLSGGAVTIQNFITSGTSAGIVPSVDGKTFHVTGSLATAGTAGNLQLQFAQTTSNANGCSMKRGSALFGMKLA